MQGCTNCGFPPRTLPADGQLYLWPPRGARRQLEGALASAGLTSHWFAPQIVRVKAQHAALERLRRWIPVALETPELRDTKCLLLPEDTRPSLDSGGEIISLRTLQGRLDGDWLQAMLIDKRLTTHVQPIVHIGDPDRIFAHECLVRGIDTDGTFVPPDVLFRAARHARMLYHLDRGARLQHIRAASRASLPANIFVNFNPTAIGDPVNCLRTTFMAIAQSGLPPERFVFEVVESDEVEDLGRLLAILDIYRQAGFRVALDDLGAGFSSLTLLSQLKPDFVKFDIELIRNIDRDPYKGSIVAKLLEVAQSLGVQTVVEGIETEGEWRWAIEHGADYGQGYLFGRPAPLETDYESEAASSSIDSAWSELVDASSTCPLAVLPL